VATADARTALRQPFFTQANLSSTFKAPTTVFGTKGGDGALLATQSLGVAFDDYLTSAPLTTSEQLSTLQLSANLFGLDDSYEH
jgi:hypothetical protein